MTKVKLDVIKPWIQDKITEILRMDDDVVVEFIYNQLEDKVFFKYIVVSLKLQNYIKIVGCSRGPIYKRVFFFFF